MINLVSNQTPQTATGALAFAVGAAMVTGQSAWPVCETPSYMVQQDATSSYSQFSEQAMAAAKQPAHADFARDLAAIHASLSERQERLGGEFETAIFGDLDSLYES